MLDAEQVGWDVSTASQGSPTTTATCSQRVPNVMLRSTRRVLCRRVEVARARLPVHLCASSGTQLCEHRRGRTRHSVRVVGAPVPRVVRSASVTARPAARPSWAQSPPVQVLLMRASLAPLVCMHCIADSQTEAAEQSTKDSDADLATACAVCPTRTCTSIDSFCDDVVTESRSWPA